MVDAPSRYVARYSLAKNKTTRFAIIIVIVLVVVLFGVKKIFDAKAQPQLLGTTSQPQSEQPKGNGVIGREFTFPLIKDAKNPKQFKFYVDRAELRDEIVVKGQKATAVKGRDFLIVTIKITNEHDQAFKINTKDFVRLSVNGNTAEWLAPDIHNDPVEVQAISTKLTRVGFPVNENVTDFALQVGEITGNKEVITLNLK